MKKWYVYEHLNPITKNPFYVGKGVGDRVANTSGRNRFWKNYVFGYLKKRGLYFETRIIQFFNTEHEALCFEQKTIKEYSLSGILLLNKKYDIQDEAVISAINNENNLPDSTESIGLFVKRKRKELRLTQPEIARKAGVGIRFLRELEQGTKLTLRIDKTNNVLNLFGSCLVPYKKDY